PKCVVVVSFRSIGFSSYFFFLAGVCFVSKWSVGGPFSNCKVMCIYIYLCNNYEYCSTSVLKGITLIGIYA
ncbi:hypothetical protein, partial [Salmonella sp. s51884]|uniref:hypothetical protein n=1 Tax=Salmonella sp. s51884 TaxID=3159654 RepID=UPI00397FC913